MSSSLYRNDPDKNYRYSLLAPTAIKGIYNHQHNQRRWYHDPLDARNYASEIMAGGNCQVLVLVEAVEFIRPKPSVSIKIEPLVRRKVRT